MSTDEGLPAAMAALADNFAAILRSQAGRKDLPAPTLPRHEADITWRNDLSRANSFRRAHVELFTVPDRFAVLHCCVFPHTHDPASIFGFDMIAGRDIATGIFLDFSPTVPEGAEPDLRDCLSPAERAGLGKSRELPEWGSIFSPAMLAVRPAGPASVARAMAIARRALSYYLSVLATPPRNRGDRQAELGQIRYINAQRRNDHTLRMLSRFTDPHAARAFMHDVLFPMPSVVAEYCA